MLRESLFSLKSFLFRNQAEDLMDSEVRYHIERETADYIGKGLSPAEARRQAMLAFGGIDKTEEECRDAWGIRRLEDLRADIIFSLRSLRKHSGYTLAAVLTLALGIGCNTALFSVLRSVVFRPLPMRDGDRTVTLRRINTKTGQPTFGFSVPEMEQYRAQAKTLDGLVEFHMMTFTLLGRVEPENVETAVVSAGYFDFFGIQPLYGRGFQTGEDQHGAAPVLVLSHRYFVKSFGANPNIVGTTVRMNDRVHTIVGILPPLPEFPAPIDVYMPASSCPTRSNPKFEQNRRAGLLQLYGRIRSGSSLSQVQSEYESILDRYKTENPDVYPAGLQWAPKATLLKDEMVRQARPTLWFLFAITGLVLLIACASVANLSLARALRREREVAIRAALGASRRRLLHQFVVEGLLISLVGGLLGLASAHAALDLLARFVQRFSVRADEIQIDLPVLLFSLGVSIVTGIVFCALPAWRTGVNIVAATKETGAASTSGVGKQRLRRILVSAQVAFSVVVLISAGLLLRSFLKLLDVNLGFQPQQVVSIDIKRNWSHSNTNEDYVAFFDRLLDRVRTTPGVLAAGITGNVPLDRALASSVGLVVEGHVDNDNTPLPVVRVQSVSPGYLEALQAQQLKGRFFTSSDREGTPRVTVVNETLARRRFPNQDPLGHRVRVPAISHEEWATIVGVVGDIRSERLDVEPAEELYFPFAQFPLGAKLLVRTAGDSAAAIQNIRKMVYDLDPEQAIASVRTLEDVMSQSLSPRLLTSRLLMLLAALTLLITVTGIGGVAAVAAGQRRNEMGIRLALGAAPRRLVATMVAEEMRMVFWGLFVGVAAALIVARFLSEFLYDTTPADPATLVSVLLVLVVAGVIACFLPALRAVRIDPLQTLRSE